MAAPGIRWPCPATNNLQLRDFAGHQPPQHGVWAPVPAAGFSNPDGYSTFAPGYRGPNPAPSRAPYLFEPKPPIGPPPPHLLEARDTVKTVKRNSPEKKKEGEETVKTRKKRAGVNLDYYNTVYKIPVKVGEAGTVFLPRQKGIKKRGGKNLNYYNAKYGKMNQDTGNPKKLSEDTPSTAVDE